MSKIIIHASFLLLVTCSIVFGMRNDRKDASATSLARQAETAYDSFEYIDALLLSEKALIMFETDPKKQRNIGEPIAVKVQAKVYSYFGDVSKIIPLLEKQYENWDSFQMNDDFAIDYKLTLAECYVTSKAYDKAKTILDLSLPLIKRNINNNLPYNSYFFHFLKANIIKSQILKEEGDSLAALNHIEDVLKHTQPYLKNCMNNGVYLKLTKQLSLLNEQLRFFNQLSALYYDNKQYKKAISICEGNFKLIKEIRDVEQSLKKEKNEKPVISFNFDMITTFGILAKSYYQIHDYASATIYAVKELEGRKQEILKVIQLNESTRLIWQHQKDLSLYWAAGIIDPSVLCNYILSLKGVILDSIINNRKTQGNIWSLKMEKELQSIHVSNNITAQHRNINVLQQEILSEKYKNKKTTLEASLNEICAGLDKDSLIVDFFQFDDPIVEGNDSACIGALIISHEKRSQIVIIKNRNEINELINNLRASIIGGNENEAMSLSSQIYQKLWAPVDANIPSDKKRIFISPEGNLNFLSFAALMDSSGAFVAEKYLIEYVSNPRDLSRKNINVTNKIVGIYANPDFEFAEFDNNYSKLTLTDQESSNFKSISLAPLPGTLSEAKKIQSLAQKSGWHSNIKIGRQASKANFSRQSPSILHFATHGFYLNNTEQANKESTRGMNVKKHNEDDIYKQQISNKFSDPMRASGIALSGANKTFALWSKNIAPDPKKNGVLTAEDVSNMNLSTTWLVVLSACETGMGQAISGEGVFGLRRAFKIAGAGNLLMTLWPVNDEITSNFMGDFYSDVFKTLDAADSLCNTQRDWLIKLRNEYGAFYAIRNVGPFAMATFTGQGKSKTPAILSMETSIK